ncbi:hypothetical protein [Streptomyces phaeochromogenes]
MSRFRTLRRAWFDEIAEELVWLLEDLSPAVADAVPKDLGPRNLVSATVLARVAQADMECQEIAFVAGDLVRLAGVQGVRAPERVEEVEELWTALREPTVPLLRSWWRESLGEGLLAHWAEIRAEEVGWTRVHQELRERWSLDSDGIWRRGLMPVEAPDGEWRGFFFDHLEAVTSGQEAAYARMLVTRWPSLAEEIEAFASEKADELAAVPHLDLVHRERALADALTAVAAGNLEQGGGELPADLRAVLRSIRDTGKSYLAWLDGEFTERLTPLERAHLALGAADAARCEAYLRQYADIWCAPESGTLPTPVFTEEDYAPLKPAERPRAVAPEWMAMVAKVYSEDAQFGWTGTVGSQPWWLYVAESGIESAAAMRFKRDGQVRIGHRTLDDPHDMLVGLPPDDPHAQNLIMRFRYDVEDPHEMCELLVLARAGRVRLGFLVRDAGGGFRVLRVVSVPMPPALREAMRGKALRALDAMTGADPRKLAVLIAPEAGGPVAGEPGESPAEDVDDAWGEAVDGGLFPRGDTLF